MATFSMTGRLSISRDTEKFHPYQEFKSQKGTGWISRRLKFNISETDSTHMLSLNDGKFEDEHNLIYTFSKPVEGQDGAKSEKLQIPFKDRLKQENVDMVAEFRKFIIDLESPEVRLIRRSVGDKIARHEDLTDEEMQKFGISSQEEALSAYDRSCKKRREFISQWDYIDCIKKLLDKGVFGNKKYRVSGNVSHAYSEANGKVYEELVPSRIYLMDDTEEEFAHMTVKFLYGQNSVNDSLDDRIVVNGWQMDYDNGLRKQIPVPTSFVIRPNNGETIDSKRIKTLKERFTSNGDTICARSTVLQIVNGSPRLEITEDMLTEEQREDLDLGLIDMDDIRRELGGSVRGERITELRFVKFGKSAMENTAYTEDQMVINPDSTSDTTNTTSDDGSDDEDIFA